MLPSRWNFNHFGECNSIPFYSQIRQMNLLD
jgi:hypothetical protein